MSAATAGGLANEISNQWHGACYDQNLRMTVSVVPRRHNSREFL